MAEKQFVVDINLDNNQLLNAKAKVGTGFTSSATKEGRFMYDNVTKRLLYDNGSVIQTVAILSDVTGLLDFKGGYNATTNVPDLTTAPNLILKGDYYVATTGGLFFTETLQAGDSLFANIDSPSVLADWVIVQGNVVHATELVDGVLKLATQVLTDAGVDDTTAVTPLKLKTASFIAKKYNSGVTSIGSGTPVTITHNLGNLKPAITIIRSSNGRVITAQVDNFTLNTFDVTANGVNFNVTVGVVG